MQKRDTAGYTIGAAALLCVVCSFAVSAAAVALRDRQDANVELDKQKNILDAAGLPIAEYGRPAKDLTQDQIDELYSLITAKLVDINTGEYDTTTDPETFDQLEAMTTVSLSDKIVDPEFNPGEQRRQKVSRVYFVRREGSDVIRQVVLPIHGKGLWGTMYGYLAVRSDLKTAQGITFYKHKETPGLGGNVDMDSWKAQWEGVKLFDDSGEPFVLVYKGTVPGNIDYAVDGLSGATITSRGVTNMVRYWLSDDGYGPFLKKLEAELAVQDSASQGQEE